MDFKSSKIGKFEHLKEKRISYCSHMTQAFWIACRFVLGVPQMIIHGLYPDVFTETASNIAIDILKKTHPEKFKKVK